MNRITTHVLDVVLGKPAAGISVRLDRQNGSEWTLAGQSTTDADGRCRDLTAEAEPGIYRLTFDTGSYFDSLDRKSMYPEITVTFRCSGAEHYHLPLLLSDNSYTTYRGS